MTWDTKDAKERRHEFVTLASAGTVTVSELCRRFGISRKTGYKWINRSAKDALRGLEDRRPQRLRWSNQTTQKVEEALLALRKEHPTWGLRKLRRRLQDIGGPKPPAVSTVGRLLKRSGCIERDQRAASALATLQPGGAERALADGF